MKPSPNTSAAAGATVYVPRFRTLRRFLTVIRRSGASMFGTVVLALYIVAALAAPLVAPTDPLKMFRGQELSAPTLAHPAGTDELGRDLWSRVIYGARVSLSVGFGGVFVAAVFGSLLGLITGYAGQGSIVDVLVMRVMDTLLAFPGILIGIIAVVLLGSGAVNVAIAVAVAHTPLMTRLVRAEVLREREKEYVQAAEALGARRRRVISRHLLPNTVNVIIVQAATSLAVAILLEAALSFLGMGAQPPTPSWGSMLRESRSYLNEAPWYALTPGIALTMLIVAVNFTADALRKTLGGRR